jgi:hypothetical protein
MYASVNVIIEGVICRIDVSNSQPMSWCVTKVSMTIISKTHVLLGLSRLYFEILVPIAFVRNTIILKPIDHSGTIL